MSSETPDPEGQSKPATLEKNPHAVALGKKGGPKGGKARAENLSPERLKEIAKSGGKARSEKLSPERRKEIAKKAIEARWAKKEP